MGQILSTNCLLKHVFFKEGKNEADKWKGEEEEEVSSYRMNLRNERKLKTERGSTRPNSVEKSVWKGQWICCKTTQGMNI
jgi:hypothetical protein